MQPIDLMPYIKGQKETRRQRIERARQERRRRNEMVKHDYRI